MVCVVVVVVFCGVSESRIRPDDDDDDDERRSNAPRCCCVEGVTVFPFPFEDFFCLGFWSFFDFFFGFFLFWETF